MQISYVTVVVAFGSYNRFLGGDHDRGELKTETLTHPLLRRYGVVVSP